MIDPDARKPPGSTDGKTPKRPGSTSSHRLDSQALGGDPPTVRSGSGGLTGSYQGLASGSSARRAELKSGEDTVGQPFTPPLPLPVAGERIDVFDLEASIGAGGMGAVFRALDTRLDRHVALKILPPEQANDPEVVQRFYQEGRAAARLDHENIARVFTIGHDGRYHYIAFEYIEGTTIRQRVEKKGPLPVGEAINFTLQIADALVHAAERGVVHRDIKPSNIIVTPHGRAKLVDMGLARRFERGGDDGLTQSGMTLGTFDYISPEQARDPRDVDVRSDLYSLGCTLFHMLTGRPPFPEGTVLQKLIQHQEEAPPDVQSLNPVVPADLASILVKLMAKDRDRRYQTPEQLVRDLLTLAGAMGLRSVSPEGLAWLSSDAPPAWERHLVWGIPALVFALIVVGLIWVGRDAGRTAQTVPPDGAPKVETVVAPSTTPATKESHAAPSSIIDSPPVLTAIEPEPTEPVAAEAPPAAPRDFEVDSSQDLLAVLASAPPRSAIVLTDKGPYNLGLGHDGRPSAERLERRDLTVRAKAGVRPVLRLARDLPPRAGGRVRLALLDFHGGRVTFEGVEFQIDPGDRSEPLVGLRLEDTELTARRCVFRRTGDVSRSRVAAVQVLASSSVAGTDRPPMTFLDGCHFDGDQFGVRASGPADVSLRDCTFAVVESAVWFDNGRSASPVSADLRLSHVSILAGESPVFRFEGTAPRVRIDDTVVAPVVDVEATLVSSDFPDSLSWKGRDNTYARVGPYLLPTDGRLGREAVRDPAQWRETADEIRESGTLFASALEPVWNNPAPAQVLSTGPTNPAQVFRLDPAHPGAPELGARRGPFGPLTSTDPIAYNATPESRQGKKPAVGYALNEPASMSRERTPSKPVVTRADESAAAITPKESSQPVEPKPTKPVEAVTESGVAVTSPPKRMNDLPEMPVMPPTVTGDGAASTEDRATSGDPTVTKPTTPSEPVSATSATSVKPSTPSTTAPATGRSDRVVIRTADQILNALNKAGSRDGQLWVAADADLELTSSIVRVTGSWRIQAEQGTTRPRLRFLPPAANSKNLSAWSAMIELRSGSLQLDGFDIILPRANAPRSRWTAFAVWPATDLNLTNCTVTVEGDQVVSAVVAVVPGEDEEEDGMNVPEPGAATVRLTDSLIRGGGDLVDVCAGRRLVFDAENAVIATGGSLVHAHGVARGKSAEPVNLTLRQVTARVNGGIVYLDSTEGEPVLPVAYVNARYSIVATTQKDAPLVRVDGQDSPSTMRDRIDWEGLGVGYHQITTYRRDQSKQVGAGPTLYDRPSWNVAVGAREKSAVAGDLKFRRDWPSNRQAWTLERDDVRLGDDSPARASGSDLGRIPDPPPSVF